MKDVIVWVGLRPSSVFRREFEIESRPFVDLSHGPGSAAVAVNDRLDDGEPHPRSLKFLISAQPLEHPEEFVAAAHVAGLAFVRREVY